MLVSRSEGPLSEVKSAIEEAGGKASVLACDNRIHFSQIRINASRFAQKIHKCIDVMHTGFVNQQLRHGLKIGLAIQIGIRSLAVTGTQSECDLMDVTQLTLFNARFDFTVPRLKPKVLMHHELRIVLFRQCHGLLCFLQIFTKRLLADDGLDALLECFGKSFLFLLDRLYHLRL